MHFNGDDNVIPLKLKNVLQEMDMQDENSKPTSSNNVPLMERTGSFIKINYHCWTQTLV